ncbi:MAG: tetratricopeptide repeat protein [Bacteroidetes bacterium]|nr:tetratricopeptide repeat protein [Bacteroidota bacterium]
MKFAFLLTFCFSFSLCLLKAQVGRSRLDSLLVAVKVNNPSASELMPVLLDISGEYILKYERDSARWYAEAGLKQSQILADSLWIAKFSKRISEVYYRQGEYDKATNYIEVAIPIFQHLNLPIEVARCYNQLGMFSTAKGDFKKSETSLSQSVEIIKKTDDKYLLAKTYSHLGFLFYKQFKLNEALDYYGKSQELLRQLKTPSSVSMSGSNANLTGGIYMIKGNLFKALESYQESYEAYTKNGDKDGIAYALNNIGLVYQELGYFDKALEPHLTALEIRKEIKDSLKIAYSLYDLGEFYRKQNQIQKASDAYLEGLKVCEAINDSTFIDQFLAMLAEIDADKGDIAEAWRYLKSAIREVPETKLTEVRLLLIEYKWEQAIPIALDIFNSADKSDLKRNKAKSTEYLIQAYEALGQYHKALEYSHIRQALTDSLNDFQNARLTRQLAFEYDSEKKEVALSNLSKQNQLQESQLKTQRYLIYVFILWGVIAVLAALGFYYLSHKNKQLAAKETELRASTLNLFANLSHELRTPLSILRIPLEQMHKGQFSGDAQQASSQMLGNVQRLTDMVDQILDIARTKENQLQLNLQYEDPIEFLRVFVGQFGSYARHKNLNLELKIPSESLSIKFDEEIWSKILNNLINNALKFTEDGCVRLEFKYLIGNVELKIIDSGNGIPPEYLSHIFNRYYRSPLENHQNLTGGLGLSLVKELINLYKGKIEVKSEVGKGTEFTIFLPHNEHFKEQELPAEYQVLNLSSIQQLADNQTDLLDLPAGGSVNPIFVQNEVATGEAKKILVIEDNLELNSAISNYLSKQYRVYQAFDGVEGFEVSQKVIPDLILTDVMMPRMDGIELAQKLHTSPETSHIPLIVISALKDEFLDQGMWKAGVVDFVQKPLDMERLSLKINSLIKSREQFKSLIQKNGWLDLTADVPVTDSDKEFLERFQNVLIENMEQDDLNIDKLSQLMFVSRMQLFRKVKSLTGMTPEKFIQKVKMQYAYELLTDKKMSNVSEVAASIGYTNLSFFSRKFKEIHGVNATDIVKRQAAQ